MSEPDTQTTHKIRKKLQIFGRQFHMPHSRGARIGIGIALVFFGCLGFLPVLGFWMIPLGLLVLSQEFDWLRKLRRRWIVRWGRRKRPNLP